VVQQVHRNTDCSRSTEPNIRQIAMGEKSVTTIPSSRLEEGMVA